MAQETQGGGEPNQSAANENISTDASVQTEVMELTAAEVDKFKAESFEAGAVAERLRITGIHAVASELGIESTSATVQRMVSGGHDLDSARGMLTDMKTELDAASGINGQHDTGNEQQQDKKAVISTADIYSRRNGGKA